MIENMLRITAKVFCAFCRLERTVYTKKSVDWTNVLVAFIISIFLMYGIWQQPDGRVALLFAFFLATAEIFVRLRWRLSLPCPHCHFDPVTYKNDKELAMVRVKARLDDLKQSGGHLLKQNNPFSQLPVVRYNPETNEKTISPPH